MPLSKAKALIDKKNEAELTKQIILLQESKHPNKDELIKYCEHRKKMCNVEAVLVEQGDISDMMQEGSIGSTFSGGHIY